jgi:hypothetical protein
MHSPFHAVARGLRVAHVGYLLACWGTTAAILIPQVVGRSFSYSSEMYCVVAVTLGLAVLLGLAGVVVGILGRVRCLKLPAEFPAARGRLLAGLILEGCGWVSLLGGAGVAVAMGFRWLPDAAWVPAIGTTFSGIMLLGGRVMFLRFLKLLAGVVDDASSARLARLSLALLLSNFAVGLLGVGVMIGGNTLSLYRLANPLAYLMWAVAGMSGLAGMVLYDRVLGGLALSVQAFAVAHRDEEEELYRSRQKEDESVEGPD